MDGNLFKIPCCCEPEETFSVINLTLNSPNAQKAQHSKRPTIKPKTPKENLLQSILNSRRKCYKDKKSGNDYPIFPASSGTAGSFTQSTEHDASNDAQSPDLEEVKLAVEKFLSASTDGEKMSPAGCAATFKDVFQPPEIDESKVRDLRSRFGVSGVETETETHQQDTTTETCRADRSQSNCLCKEDSSTKTADSAPAPEKSDTSIADHRQFWWTRSNKGQSLPNMPESIFSGKKFNYFTN